MGASREWMNSPQKVQMIQEAYRNTKELLSMPEIAKKYEVSNHTVSACVNLMYPEERKILRRIRHSSAKLGNLNPMYGKTMEKHHNFIGECGDTYKTLLVDGRRMFVHRLEMEKLIGLPAGHLPTALTVHHIDGNPSNNDPDNLALCTNKGHQAIHKLMENPDLVELKSRRYNSLEYAKYLISQSKETTVLK